MEVGYPRWNNGKYRLVEVLIGEHTSLYPGNSGPTSFSTLFFLSQTLTCSLSTGSVHLGWPRMTIPSHLTQGWQLRFSGVGLLSHE